MKNKYGLKLGIVIIGYKNIDGINRLLNSLDNVDFGNDEVLLIFSIDHSDINDVEQIASLYKWNHGEKEIVTFKQNLGLRTHILKCGDYLTKYDLDALIVLEDDIYCSRNMYSYALETVNYYCQDETIAGISLYKHEYNILAKHPFTDYKDDSDVFFMQYAQSWGQVWLKSQWDSFKEWYTNKEWNKMDLKSVPTNVLKWKNSWLKYHIMYCIDRDLYFVYPRVSLTTNFSDAGVHRNRQNTNMQVSLDNSITPKWNLKRIYNSYSVYDAYFQNIRMAELCGANVIIDLYGVKGCKFNGEYLLSLKKYNYKKVRSWGLQLRPIEDNLFKNIPGDEICLYDTSVNEKNKKNNRRRLFEYDLKGICIVSTEGISEFFMFLYCYLKNRFLQIKKNIQGKK